MTKSFQTMTDDLSRHRLVLTNPSIWPLWPLLPLTRRSDRGLELGVMFDARTMCGLMGYSATVFLTSMFFPPMSIAKFLQLPREVFDSTEELLARGWRID
jgi:hypothetical protein